MRILSMVVFVGALFAQVPPAMMEGRIVDDRGTPVAYVEVEINGESRRLTHSDPEGRVRIPGDTSRIYVRRTGFWGQLLVAPKNGFRIELSPASPVLPSCDPSPACIRVFGELCLIEEPGVAVQRSGFDTWHVEILFEGHILNWVDRDMGKGNPLTPESFAIFENRPVFRSGFLYRLQYPGSEAKGTRANGLRSRFFDLYPETLYYSDVPAQVAAKFDRMLDRLCQLTDLSRAAK